MIEPERPAYDLTPQSLVWDVGSYRGDFSVAVLEKFGCHVMAFEPMLMYADALGKNRPTPWKGALAIYSFGLADRDFEQDIPLAGDRTSAHPEAASDPGFHAGPLMPARFRDVIGFMDELAIHRVDLAKINIEGGEYALLRRLIDSGYISRFGHLQVQFHTFMPEFGELYLALKKDLERTHTLSWRQPWRWESWARR